MGQRLQKLREKAGLSQFDLAKTADVPIGTIRNWEQDINTPRLDTAYRVARALGIKLDALATADLGERQPRKTGRKRSK